MAYGDAWEQDTLDRLHRWQEMRWRRESGEQHLAPDERLDEVGWDIYYCATRVMSEREAAALALEGPYAKRVKVRADLLRRDRIALEARYRELRPNGPGLVDTHTQAADQLAFWTDRLGHPSFIYFIQESGDGPVKIGFSRRPERRPHELQTGNPRELVLRHVVPGDRAMESQLHRRFEPARIRGEWFGREYLPVIMSFAGGLADRMVHAYDDGGTPPRLIGGDVRTARELERIRSEIERLWLAGHDVPAIAQLAWLSEDEVQEQIREMRTSPIYDVQRPGGFDLRRGRLVAYRAKRPHDRMRMKPGQT